MQSEHGKKYPGNKVTAIRIMTYLGVQAPETHTGTVIHTVISTFY